MMEWQKNIADTFIEQFLAQVLTIRKIILLKFIDLEKETIYQRKNFKWKK